jgi:hypothetical protein
VRQSPVSSTLFFRKSFALLLFSLPIFGGLGAACNNSSTTPPLSSLRQSGQVSFVCVNLRGDGAPLDQCPVGASISTSSTARSLTVASLNHDLYALVTQTVTGEVALLRISARAGVSGPTVIDVDPSNPGVTPLRVGQDPSDMVTTPGGKATFVSVREVGKPGLFALPTRCLWGPEAGESPRDLTSWPACSLPSPPGRMVIVADEPDAQGRVRTSCDGSYQEPKDPTGAAGANGADDCAVDLATETNQPGRQKLIVTLPDRGTLAVVDAQRLLDRAPGSFDPCPIEAEFELRADPSGERTQPLPPDLAGQGCFPEKFEYPELSEAFDPKPAGLSLGRGILFVADQAAPVIHRVSTEDVCQLTEKPPLLPTSMLEPDRLVTSSRLAVSPVTRAGSQFLYAIDESPARAADVMVFDITSENSPRTPLVRPGSKDMPFEIPDRIQFPAAAKDVGFVQNDEPIVDPDTDVGEFGVLCDPDPSLSPDDEGARYRSNESLTAGAGINRRGIFAYVLTSDGNLNVVDLEDYDAACRRPIQVNRSSSPDFRGCLGDVQALDYYTSNGRPTGVPTVTNEVSCRVVEPHRARAHGRQGYVITNDTIGTGAPTLLSLPRLTLFGRSQPVSRDTVEGRKRPILLGADFGGEHGLPITPAQVYVGTTQRSRDSETEPLDINPNSAEQSNVVLPFVEPRAYPETEVVTVAYEGDLDGLHSAGRIEIEADDKLRLSDVDASYCKSGTQDVATTRDLLEKDYGLTGDPLSELALRYADYVQVTSSFPLEDDEYWQGAGAACVGDQGFAGCDSVFGKTTVDDLRRERDLKILAAYDDHLELAPALLPTGSNVRRYFEALSCCFPGALSYRVRAAEQWVVRGTSSGYRHPVVAVADADGELACRLACDPVRGSRRGRLVELSSTSCDDPNPEAPDFCGVGPRTSRDVVCAYDSTSGAVQPGTGAGRCIFDDGTRRFALYRGLEQSARGMAFLFDVGGGFLIDSVNLSSVTRTNVLPVSLATVPSFGAAGVVDAQDRGVLLIEVRSNSVVTQFY